MVVSALLAISSAQTIAKLHKGNLESPQTKIVHCWLVVVLSGEMIISFPKRLRLERRFYHMSPTGDPERAKELKVVKIIEIHQFMVTEMQKVGMQEARQTLV
eukprot:6062440-Amphidinium_carterae.1